jgi:hypothetical protein
VYADLNRDGKIDIVPSERVSASTYLTPGQPIRAILTFNDSRYNSTQGFNLKSEATVDQTVWEENNGCKMCGKSLDQMGCSAGMRGDKKSWDGGMQGYPINVYMENGYGRIEFNATLPKTLLPGQHTIKVKPTLLSSPLTLRAAEAQFSIADGLYTFVVIVRNIFSRLTGFFVISIFS